MAKKDDDTSNMCELEDAETTRCTSPQASPLQGEVCRVCCPAYAIALGEAPNWRGHNHRGEACLAPTTNRDVEAGAEGVTFPGTRG
jgi:hypothetical protein